MNCFLYLTLLVLSPIVMNASGDTLKTELPPVKRWNITASVGYGFPFAKQVLGAEGTVDSNSTTESKLIRGTYGKGIFSFISVGYKINQHFGSEFGIHSTWGNKLMTNKLTDLSTGNVYNENFTQVSTNGIFAGFFMTDNYSKFHIKFHNALLVGVMNYATEESFSNGAQQPVWKYSGRVSYGWLSRLGASYDISDKINIGLTSFFLMHSWSPAEKNTLNGNNKITFTDNISFNGINNPPSNKLPRLTYPLHASGINIFIAYNF